MEESGSQDCDPAVVAKVAEILGVTRDDLLKVRTRVKLFLYSYYFKVISRPATPRTSSPASSLAPSTQVSRASSPGLAPAASSAVPLLGMRPLAHILNILIILNIYYLPK